MAWRTNAELYRKGDTETIASGQAKINYEEPQHRDDGGENWLGTSKIPLSDMHGNTIALLGLYEDITDRKAMELQLRRRPSGSASSWWRRCSFPTSLASARSPSAAASAYVLPARHARR